MALCATWCDLTVPQTVISTSQMTASRRTHESCWRITSHIWAMLIIIRSMITSMNHVAHLSIWAQTRRSRKVSIIRLFSLHTRQIITHTQMTRHITAHTQMSKQKRTLPHCIHKWGVFVWRSALTLPHRWAVSRWSHKVTSIWFLLALIVALWSSPPLWVTAHVCMSYVTHANRSCRTLDFFFAFVAGCSPLNLPPPARVMSHIWMSHVTHMDESHHTYEWVMRRIWMRHVTHMNESCHTWMSHVTDMNSSCHTWARGTSQLWMSHITRMNASRHASFSCATLLIHMCHMTPWNVHACSSC